MSDRAALDLLRRARLPGVQSPGGEHVFSGELRPILAELEKADPDTGKPAGVYSDLALDLLNGRALPGDLRGIDLHECSNVSGPMLERARLLAGQRRWRPAEPSGVRALPPKDGHAVFLTAAQGFAVDAAGSRPADQAALGNALFHAGEWVQASFGTGDNLFAKAGLDLPGKRAVVAQFKAVADHDLAHLNDGQRQQLLGNVAGLLVELIKSVDINGLGNLNRAEQRALIGESFALLSRVLDDPRLGVDVKQMLVGYLQGSESFLARLETAEKKAVQARHEAYNPTNPFDYAEWDRLGKSVIRVDDIEGEGEGFLYGFVEWLKANGLGDAQWREGKNTFQLVEGDGVNQRSVLRCVVAADDPINTWGRPMTVEIEASYFQNNMFRGLGRPEVDITGYNGHSGFARNTLKSLPNMPEQQGAKMFYRFVCAGMDAENPIALRAPKAFANSYTTQDSGYFRKRQGPHGEYAYEAEGWEAIRCMIRGVLGKQSHAQIQESMRLHANWPGHTAGNTNNCVGPGDKRRGGSGDLDQDGIPNMYDVMPTGNLFAVKEDAAREFELKVPEVPAEQIKGDRAFQVIQFVNTATNYSGFLGRLNENRKLNAHPEGVWFQAEVGSKEYVRFTAGSAGSINVQLSSALADMTTEGMRAVLFYETSRYLLERNGGGGLRTPAERLGAHLLFVTCALEYDMSWRDDAVFDGVKKLFGVPDGVDYGTFRAESFGMANRHNYGGDRQALAKVLERHGAALGQPGVGQNAVPVSA